MKVILKIGFVYDKIKKENYEQEQNTYGVIYEKHLHTINQALGISDRDTRANFTMGFNKHKSSCGRDFEILSADNLLISCRRIYNGIFFQRYFHKL